jgi:hypothetical protein
VVGAEVRSESNNRAVNDAMVVNANFPYFSRSKKQRIFYPKFVWFSMFMINE